MTLGANVRSVDALKTLKAAVLKFVSETDKALQEVNAEVHRVTDWIEHIQPIYWKSELHKRDQAIAQAKDDLRRVQLTISDHKPSAIEQKKSLKRAQQRYEEARRKIQVVRDWRTRFDQEVNDYRGQSQAVVASVDGHLPKALSLLEHLLVSLDAYLSVQSPQLGPEMTRDVEAAAAMTRPVTRRPSPKAASEALERYRLLRQRSLSPADRESVPLLGEVLEPSGHESMLSEPINVLDRLQISRTPPRPGDVVVFEPGFDTAERVFLERIAAEGKGDSGWYVGRTEDPDKSIEHAAATVSRFLLAYPAFREVFALSAGYLVVLQKDAIEIILDEHDEDVWRETPAESDPSTDHSTTTATETTR